MDYYLTANRMYDICTPDQNLSARTLPTAHQNIPFFIIGHPSLSEHLDDTDDITLGKVPCTPKNRENVPPI